MFLHKILDLQAAFLFIKYKIFCHIPGDLLISYFFINMNELGIKVFDTQAELIINVINYCYNYRY